MRTRKRKKGNTSKNKKSSKGIERTDKGMGGGNSEENRILRKKPREKNTTIPSKSLAQGSRCAD